MEPRASNRPPAMRGWAHQYVAIAERLLAFRPGLPYVGAITDLVRAIRANTGRLDAGRGEYTRVLIRNEGPTILTVRHTGSLGFVPEYLLLSIRPPMPLAECPQGTEYSSSIRAVPFLWVTIRSTLGGRSTWHRRP